MKVLYIDGVAQWGGASRSLTEVLNFCSSEIVEKYFVMCRGTVVPQYSKLATSAIIVNGLTRFDNTLYGYYRGLRWIILLREICNIPSTLFSLLKAQWKWKSIDIIHVNELTEIIPGILAKKLFKVPLVVHVRSVTYFNPSSYRCKWMHKLLLKYVDALIPIDENVKASLPDDLNTYVINNSYFPNSSNVDLEMVNNFNALKSNIFKVGFVGNVLKSKGIRELMEAARKISEIRDDIEFIIVGGEARNNKGFKPWLLRQFNLWEDSLAEAKEFISKYKLNSQVHFFGKTMDIATAYHGFNIVCFPSYYDAPGRPILEAAYFGVPSIACISRPMNDTFTHLETGYSIPAKDANALANAILYFADHPEEVVRMGSNAKQLAKKNFNAKKNAEKLVELYKSLLKAGSPEPRPRN